MYEQLLHIQNYVNTESICAGHTWYLSADFQLFIISPLLIYPAFRRFSTWLVVLVDIARLGYWQLRKIGINLDNENYL